MRRTLLLGSVAVVAAAAVLVPLPLVELAPGPTFDVPPVVSLDGHAQRAPTGRLLAVTVLLTRPRATDLVGAWLTHDREILRQQRVVPPGVSERQYLEAERRVFAESAQLGAAVGLRAAGLPVDASGGGARVVAVVRGSGADGRLRPGDVVTAANGQPIRLWAGMKTFSTVPKGLRTVDLATGEPSRPLAQRTDVCAVPAGGVVGESAAAFVVADAMLEKFGGDSLAETQRNLRAYLDAVGERS